MKRPLIENVAASLFICSVFASITVLFIRVDDLQHEVKRLEAMIQFHDELLIPDAELRGE